MRQSLIALATAGILVSGAAAADSFTFRVDSQRGPGFVVVQNDADEWRRWYDDGRRFSIDERQAQIHARIKQGFDVGQLTRREARQLERRLALIENKERGYEYDGRLNRAERADLNDDLDQLARRLRFERRDAQNRY
jgi:hypothetical protein